MCYQLPFLVSLLAINLNSYSLPVIGTNISRSVSFLSSGSVWAFLVKIADCIWKQCQWLTKPPKELAAGSAIRNYQEATHFRSRNLIHSSFEFWTLSCTDNSPFVYSFYWFEFRSPQPNTLSSSKPQKSTWQKNGTSWHRVSYDLSD